MIEFGPIGKLLIVFGFILIIVGLFFILAPKIPWIGRLPGDIYIHKKGVTFHFPVVTCILISIIVSIILWLFIRR